MKQLFPVQASEPKGGKHVVYGGNWSGVAIGVPEKTISVLGIHTIRSCVIQGMRNATAFTHSHLKLFTPSTAKTKTLL